MLHPEQKAASLPGTGNTTKIALSLVNKNEQMLALTLLLLAEQ